MTKMFKISMYVSFAFMAIYSITGINRFLNIGLIIFWSEIVIEYCIVPLLRDNKDFQKIDEEYRKKN